MIFGLFYVLCCSLAFAINWAGGQNKKSNHCIHHCSSNVSLFLLNQRNSSCLKVSFEDAFLKKRGLSLGAESDLNADNQIFGQLALWCAFFICKNDNILFSWSLLLPLAAATVQVYNEFIEIHWPVFLFQSWSFIFKLTFY